MGCGDCNKTLDNARAEASRARAERDTAEAVLIRIDRVLDDAARTVEQEGQAPEALMVLCEELARHLDRYWDNVSRETQLRLQERTE